MLRTVRSIWYKTTSHSVGKNALALAALNAANYLIPLGVVPYLTRSLGVERFGVVAVTLATIQFAYVLTDYGFTLSATRDVALHATDRQYICRKISAVWGAKVPLVLIALVAMLLLPRLVPKMALYRQCFDAAWLAVVAMALQPIWLFLGIEKMKNVAGYRVATVLLYAGLVLVLVQGPDDAASVIYAWGMAQALGFLLAVCLALRLGYVPCLTPVRDSVRELRASAEYFWSRASVAVYTSANTVILGAVSPIQAAHYSVCEFVYKGGQSVTSPINTALFPYMTKSRDWRLFVRLLIGVGAVLAAGCVVVALSAALLLGFLFGPEYTKSAPVLVVFCGLVFVTYLGASFGYPAFTAIGDVRIANISVAFGTCIQIGVVSLLYFFGRVEAFTMVLAVLATETFVLLFRAGFLIRAIRALSTESGYPTERGRDPARQHTPTDFHDVPRSKPMER